MPAKATHQTDRRRITQFQQLKNIGPAMAEDFERLGLRSPQDLIGADGKKLYRDICELDQKFYDPCVLDTYLAAVDYMSGNPPQVWWNFTELRKRNYASLVEEMRNKYQ